MISKKFTNVDELINNIQDFDLDIILLGRALHNAYLLRNSIKDINIQFFTLRYSVEYKGSVHSDYYSFTIIKTLNKEIYNGVELTNKSFLITEPNDTYHSFGCDGHIGMVLTIPKNIIYKVFGKIKSGIYSVENKLLEEFYLFLYKVLHKNIENENQEEYLSNLIIKELEEVLSQLKDIENTRFNRYEKFKEIAAFMKINSNNSISINEISEYFKITDRTIRNIFMQEIGIAPKQYQKALELNNLKHIIANNPKESISKLLIESGLHNQSVIIQDFKNFFNCTPSVYKEYINKRNELKTNSKELN